MSYYVSMVMILLGNHDMTR